MRTERARKMTSTEIGEHVHEVVEGLGDMHDAQTLRNAATHLGAMALQAVENSGYGTTLDPNRIISSVTIELHGAHDHVHVWCRGGKAGTLIVGMGVGGLIRSLLMPPLGALGT